MARLRWIRIQWVELMGGGFEAGFSVGDPGERVQLSFVLRSAAGGRFRFDE
jgi:hypothetical protein